MGDRQWDETWGQWKTLINRGVLACLYADENDQLEKEKTYEGEDKISGVVSLSV